MNLEQEVFNDCIKFLRKQGLDKPSLYCKVAKTKCAVGYLYSKLKGNDECLIGKDSSEVLQELYVHYKTLPMTFLWDLTLMHDNAIRYDLPLEVLAKEFALKYNLVYTEIKMEDDSEKQTIPSEDLPLAA